MYPAADDGGRHSVGQQESGRDSTISKSHRAIHHLRDEAGEDHDAEAPPVDMFRKGPDEMQDLVKRHKGQDGMSQDHEEESEKAPFDDLLPKNTFPGLAGVRK